MISLKMLLADLDNFTHPPSGKMIHREVVDPKAEPKEYRTFIVDDPNATPWEIVGGVAVRYVGYGVNADAAQEQGPATVGVRQQRQKHPHRGGRERIYRRDPEVGVQETAGESETEEEVTTHASDS